MAQRGLFKVTTFDKGGNIGGVAFNSYTVIGKDAEDAIKRATPEFLNRKSERIRDVQFVSHIDVE